MLFPLDSFRLVEPHSSIYSPNYSFAFAFENEFDYQIEREFFIQHWYTSIYLSLVYVVFVVFLGQKFMSSRAEPFRLKRPIAIWSGALALFSIAGTLRTWPEMVHVLNNFGFHDSVCSVSYHTKVPITSFWIHLFILSKAPEFVDTIFVVLRKQNLIFLHWYHHATVIVFTWYNYADVSSLGRWYANMNYAAHSFSYSYFCLKAFGLRIPRQLAMSITIAQLAQMVMGTFVTFYAFITKVNGHYCEVSYSTLYFGMAIYISYFVLYAQFFISSYLGCKPKIAAKALKKSV